MADDDPAGAAESSEQLGRATPTGEYGHGTSGNVYNPATGQGHPDKDPTTQNHLVRNLWMTRRTLQAAYAESDMVRKLISVLPEDALARGLMFPDLDMTEEQVFRDRMDELNVVPDLRLAGMWANLFGDGYVYLDDGTAEDEPFDIDAYQMGALTGLPTFTGYEIVPDPDSMVRTFGRKDFGIPAVYMLRQGSSAYTPVDPSRLIRTSYLPPPPGGWEESEASGLPNKNRSCCSLGMMNALLPLVMAELEGVGAVRRLTYRASVLHMGVEGFEALVQEDVDKAMAAVEQVNTAMSIWGIFAHPKGQDIGVLAVNFAGLDGVLEKNLERIAIGADVPYSRFLGVEPSGLNASGEASTRRYAGKVAQYQREKLDPILDRVAPLIAKDVGFAEVPRWTWPHYITRSSKDEADETKVRVETLNSLIDNLQYAVEAGLLMEETARQTVESFVMALTTRES